MICSTCQTVNPDKRTQCLECGAKLKKSRHNPSLNLTLPVAKSSVPQPIASKGGLVCPFCHYCFPYSLKQYISSGPLGKYHCPKCNQPSYLKQRSPWVWLIRIPCTAIGGLLSFLLGLILFKSFMAGIITLTGGIVIFGFLIDIWIEARFMDLQEQRVSLF